MKRFPSERFLLDLQPGERTGVRAVLAWLRPRLAVSRLLARRPRHFSHCSRRSPKGCEFFWASIMLRTVIVMDYQNVHLTHDIFNH